MRSNRVGSLTDRVFRVDSLKGVKINFEKKGKKKVYSARVLIEPPAVHVPVVYIVLCADRVLLPRLLCVLQPELIELIGVVTREFNSRYLFPSIFITRDRVPRAETIIIAQFKITTTKRVLSRRRRRAVYCFCPGLVLVAPELQFFIRI